MVTSTFLIALQIYLLDAHILVVGKLAFILLFISLLSHLTLLVFGNFSGPIQDGCSYPLPLTVLGWLAYKWSARCVHESPTENFLINPC